MNDRISVRGLVEFILRHGDIDNRRTVATDEAMQAGSRIHRLIQSQMGTEYKAEYPIKYSYDTELCHIEIDGRADGIITYPDQVIVDEIKGTYRNVEKIDEPEILHLAQAKCYAAVYLIDNNLSKISVRITYVNLENEEIKYLQSGYEAEEILEWFNNLLLEYAKWADMRASWYELRQQSIQNLEFPYPYREGQKELVGHVYRTIYHGKKLFIEAPTGTGKTLSVLFPAVRSVGEGRGDIIFYLTARTIARTVAEEAFGVLKEHGLKARNLTLTAKEKICPLEEIECNPVACPYADGHFDRINECLFELITNNDTFSREVIEEYAQRYKVCPFELSLDVSLFSDCVIGDYNYLFDPSAHLKRFFAEGRKGDYIFLIDEAHNLVDRGREMYSATLIKEHLLATKRACKEMLPRIASAIDKCNTDMLVLKRSGNGKQSVENEITINQLIVHLIRLQGYISEYLSEHTDGLGHDEILELYFEISDFLSIYELMQDNYIIYTDYTADNEFFVKLFNVDPALNLADCMSKGRSSILFSATLLPIQYYKSLLGGRPEDYEVYAHSVFDPGKRLLFAAKDISTRYTDRSKNQYEYMAEYIHAIADAHPGNYMVFAPSYNYMYEVYSAYTEKYHDGESEEVIYQTNQMKESDKEDFLRRFRGFDEGFSTDIINAEIEVEDKSLVGFCVLGGIFSEGIDLKEDALIGVIIMGTGLPQIGGERDLLRDYFESKGASGFDYAYRFPGMNRVLQAAGRLIRTTNDTGVIALLDERYLQNDNRRLFPKEWSDIKYLTLPGAKKEVNNFWNRQQN